MRAGLFPIESFPFAGVTGLNLHPSEIFLYTPDSCACRLVIAREEPLSYFCDSPNSAKGEQKCV